MSGIGGDTLLSVEKAKQNLEDATAILFQSDRRVRSVGIAQHGQEVCYRAVRNVGMAVPMSTPEPEAEINRIPVQYVDTEAEVETLAKVPCSGVYSATPGEPPEVKRHRHVTCGLQIQNFDHDEREGVLNGGKITMGTLGCFVEGRSGGPAFLSCNHVIAGDNDGREGDRILQPGATESPDAHQIGRLSSWVDLEPSSPETLPGQEDIKYNIVDVAAGLLEEVDWDRGYLRERGLDGPRGIDTAELGDTVYKVGRTTGLTYGEVVEIATTVGPIPYGCGRCWFSQSFVVEGNGGAFGKPGDSGAVVLQEDTGRALGILYAGNGQQTYICPIAPALEEIECRLA